MIQIINQIVLYINSLDWSYILTFILLTYAVNYSKVLDWIYKLTKLKIQTRYRVVLIGFIYGVFLFYLRGYSTANIEPLLQSFVFAMVFHKLIIDKILQQIVVPEKSDL